MASYTFTMILLEWGGWLHLSSWYHTDFLLYYYNTEVSFLHHHGIMHIYYGFIHRTVHNR